MKRSNNSPFKLEKSSDQGTKSLGNWGLEHIQLYGFVATLGNFSITLGSMALLLLDGYCPESVLDIDNDLDVL